MKPEDDLYTLVEQFPKNDPAWNLLDAFDAVTNGMENSDAMKKACRLKNAELEPWKLTVKAIHSLYAGDDEQCRRAAEKIPADSVPARLKPVFTAWLARRELCFRRRRNGEKTCGEPPIADENAVELFDMLIIEPHPLCLVAEQAEEALRQELFEQFGVLSAKVLSGLAELSEPLALRYAAYCLRLFDRSESPVPRGVYDNFFSLAPKILGTKPARTLAEFAGLVRAREVKPAQPDLFVEIIDVPSSFEELALSLPPALRYLGPGAWIKAIKESHHEL